MDKICRPGPFRMTRLKYVEGVNSCSLLDRTQIKSNKKQNSTLTKKTEKRRDNKVNFYFIFNQYGVYAQLWKIRKCEQESH